MKNIRLTAFFLSCSALLGCAPWKLDKSVIPKESDVSAIKNEIAKVRELQKATYEISIFAVDRCEAKAKREPFSLITVGNLAGLYKDEKIAAYYQAENFDEKWRVLWASEDSPIKPGIRVTKINGEELENNKTGAGEFPLIKYFLQNAKAKQDAVSGIPYIVTLDDEKKIEIPLVDACDVQVWAMPVFEDSDIAEIPTKQFRPVVLPKNAIHAAISQDEYRYLAGIAVYYSASNEAITRRAVGAGALVGGVALVIAVPILYPFISPLAVRANNAAVNGMELNAAMFSTKILIDLGGNANAGIDLIARLDEKKLKADMVFLSDENRKKLQKFILENNTSFASSKSTNLKNAKFLAEKSENKLEQ